MAVVVAVVLCGLVATASASAANYVPGVVVVGYEQPLSMTPDQARLARADTAGLSATASSTSVVQHAARRQRHHRDPAAAAQAGRDVRGSRLHRPRGRHLDPGRSRYARTCAAGGRRCSGTSFRGQGVNAPQAWANLRADGRAGGRGVVIAVLDTGVAYRTGHSIPAHDDLRRPHEFVDPYDFVAKQPGRRVPARPRGPWHVRRGHGRRGDEQRLRAHGACLRRLDHAGPGARRGGAGDAITIASGHPLRRPPRTPR